MKRIFLVALSILSLQAICQEKSITGFFDATNQLALEKKFDANLSSQDIGQFIRQFSDRPHPLGSAAGKLYAEQIRDLFQSWGWDAKIEKFKVLFPTPKVRLLEMTSPVKYRAVLKEPALKEDATSSQKDQLPTYNAWSGDGDVTADLVFVNYGLPDDYEELDKLGVDVKGKIVIAKYGRSWRGIKPKVAQEHGAIGCLIYSDPVDDGYAKGDAYPIGAYKSEYGVQRGSVMDMVIHPGDPLTPGGGAVENAKRLDRLDATTILKIPVLPISYHDATPLLKALTGPVVPDGWQGGLPFTYHVGPGATKAHLKLSFNWDMVDCYDVIARMQGEKFPDEWVIRGNHHDAWVNGAADPISGLAPLLEEAKSIGLMVKNGWKPDRTLVYCAWDGEEPGLIGSTEWVETHMRELQEKAVVYINTDGNGRGFLYAGGSHALEPLMDEIAKDVKDPQIGVSVFERKNANDALTANGLSDKKKAFESKDLKLSAMGSGSDYSAFIQHAGIPALNLGFGGEDDGGEYHSIYDSYDLYARFKDPNFDYGVALSKVAGHAVLRMAEADILPFDFTHLASTIETYTNEVTKLIDDTRDKFDLENKIISSGGYAIGEDPTKKYAAPKPKPEVPFIDFSPLKNALSDLRKSADSLQKTYDEKIETKQVSPDFNKDLYQGEQQLLAGTGLPRREWYKHVVYAPGFYTGYGVKTLPGIREAIEKNNWKEAEEQIKQVAEQMEKLAKYLSDMAEL